MGILLRSPKMVRVGEKIALSVSSFSLDGVENDDFERDGDIIVEGGSEGRVEVGRGEGGEYWFRGGTKGKYMVFFFCFSFTLRFFFSFFSLLFSGNGPVWRL